VDLDSSGVGAKGEEVLLTNRVSSNNDELEEPIGWSKHFQDILFLEIDLGDRVTK